MKKINWQYYFARKFSLQRFEVVLRVFLSDFYWKDFRVRLQNMLIKPEEGGNHAIWLDAAEYEAAIRKIFNVVCKDLKSFRYYKQMIKRTQRAWLVTARNVGVSVRSNLSNKALGKLYDTFIHWHQEHFNKPIWIPFPIEPVLSEAAEEALVSVLTRANQMSEYQKYFQIVFSPDQKNAITRSEEALVRLALLLKTGKLPRKASVNIFERITKEYGFIPCYDVIDPPWDRAHFEEELRSLLKKSREELQKQADDLRTRFGKHRQDFLNFLRSVAMKKRERELLTMAHELVFIKDERDDYRRMGSYAGRPLFSEMGRRLGTGLREASYLTIEETKAWLHRGIPPPSVSIIKERVKGYLLLRKNGEQLIVASGNVMKRILKREIGSLKQKQRNEVKGVVGSSGKATGSVVIVHTKHDLRRVVDGAIMVAVTTNPDFVPAMQKCKAIVTDEGGVTAHASIVSRELHIPCIVGTKFATRVFKDGDHVEVDANKGIVKKI